MFFFLNEDCSAIQFFHKNDQNLLMNENICESIINSLFQPFHNGCHKYDVISSEQLPFEIALSAGAGEARGQGRPWPPQ